MTDGTDRVVLDLDEAAQIADKLDTRYEYSKEDSYQTTDDEAKRLAEMLRGRLPEGHEPYAGEGWR